MNRHHVNSICRRLAAEGVITRHPGAGGKLVNTIVSLGDTSAAAANAGGRVLVIPAAKPPRQRREPSDLMNRNIEQLADGFAGYVEFFEQRQAFTGPSLYFHERAIERRRGHNTVGSLLDDERFLEYVYAVLPAWGMHRMGPQKAKVGDFVEIVAALRVAAPALEILWPLHVTSLQANQVDEVAAVAWDVIASIKVSTSGTQIVAGSKFLHHLLPDLIPPIDRQYTFRFFTGQKAVAAEREAFLAWFPRLVEIARRCRGAIFAAIDSGGFMATGPAKVIDNAIMGFVQQRQR